MDIIWILRRIRPNCSLRGAVKPIVKHQVDASNEIFDRYPKPKDTEESFDDH